MKVFFGGRHTIVHRQAAMAAKQSPHDLDKIAKVIDRMQDVLGLAQAFYGRMSKEGPDIISTNSIEAHNAIDYLESWVGRQESKRKESLKSANRKKARGGFDEVPDKKSRDRGGKN